MRRCFAIVLALLLLAAADPRLSRARALLWSAHYAEADTLFRAILGDNPCVRRFFFAPEAEVRITTEVTAGMMAFVLVNGVHGRARVRGVEGLTQ